MFTQWVKPFSRRSVVKAMLLLRGALLMVLLGMTTMTTVYAEPSQLLSSPIVQATPQQADTVLGGLGEQFTDCKSPRPAICYEVFRPVCAERDTGVRCVTEPCPSTENMTYANDCKACADQSVLRFQAGSCEDLAIELLIPKPSKKPYGLEAVERVDTAGK